MDDVRIVEGIKRMAEAIKEVTAEGWFF
jgi:hypothetical protein